MMIDAREPEVLERGAREAPAGACVPRACGIERAAAT